MKWVEGVCDLSKDLHAMVYQYCDAWAAVITGVSNEDLVWASRDYPTAAAAKSAVHAWIGKTIAQLGNALAAGEPRVDEE